MHAGSRYQESSPIGRWRRGLSAVGLCWWGLAMLTTIQAQEVPSAPAPLPSRPRPAAVPVQAPADDPFATPAPIQTDEASQPGANLGQAPARDLTTRYLLIETYSENDGGAAQGLSQYQVAFRETVTELRDNPQGAPDQQVTTRQARFTERPIEVGPGDNRMVSALIRRYGAARVDPNPWARAGGAPLMDGLTVWYEPPSGGLSRILSLTPGRSLLEQEYRFAKGNPLVSDLAYILPEFPVQIYDAWPVDRRGLSALLSTPVAQGNVQAKLADVRPAGEDAGAEQVAVINLGGEVVTQQGPTQLNVQIEFTFTPSPPGNAGAGGAAATAVDERADTPVEGHGGITKVRLAQVTTVPRQGADGPLGGTTRRSMVLQRRWPGDGPPIERPKVPPEATPENSWLTFVDLDGRFSIRYPQEYVHDYGAGLHNLVVFRKAVGPTPGRPDSLVLGFFDEQLPRADTVFPGFFEKHRQYGFEVRSTAPVHLPADQWPGMDVNRVEAALTPDPNAAAANPAAGQLPQRLHFDGYLLLFTRKAALTAEAVTAQDRAATFRDEVEAILKTFRLGTPGQAKP